ncbi:MAG TPA: tRNA (N(6)-L-threonylcarbamoyladenosine(37)-C(2))-methylthiotransferase MtaB [Chloroflexota bacterium]|nr:tRNA (N(6)-L-threonylcarbamoyladenosine(37)-C(2))-methylthiotransferase MtaB [Chloroflexota bacterium]
MTPQVPLASASAAQRSEPTGEDPPKVAFYSLGCKVNQSEIDALQDEFSASGFECVPFENLADIYVINTCSVTHVGDAKSRQTIRRAARTNPNALIVATGCYATIAHEWLAGERVLVVRNRDKDQLLSIVREHVLAGFGQDELIESPAWLDTAQLPPTARARATVKVQDGCDGICSYCIIPRARGRSVSLEPDQVLQRVRTLTSQGHAEVVITGIDLGSYGERRADRLDLAGLLSLVLDQTDVHRVRISSVEPGDFDLAWVSLWPNPRLCRHLHVPLQAGSDSVLARMRRKYDTNRFWQMVCACRDAIPGLAVTTDIITGFPGETDEEFAEGLDFIERCRFDGMHVFPYSVRSGTSAVRLEGHVSEPVKQHRASILREIAATAKANHVSRNVGSTQEVVWESERQGVWRGLTDNNVRVFGDGDGCRANAVQRRTLSGIFGDGCWGESITPAKRLEIPLVAV